MLNLEISESKSETVKLEDSMHQEILLKLGNTLVKY